MSVSLCLKGSSGPFPLAASANGRYLVTAQRRPFLLMGDAPQGLIGNLSIAQADAYLANRQSAGFNAVWFHLLSGPTYLSHSDGSTYDNIKPFTSGTTISNYDIATPNETYFARADAMINLAASHNLVVFLNAMDMIDWQTCMEANGNTKTYNFGAYVGNRYKDFKNIVWYQGNDFQTWATEEQPFESLLSGVLSTDSNRLQTALLAYLQSRTDQAYALWGSYVSLNTIYTYYPAYDEMLNGYNSSPVRPTFLGESNYEDEQGGGTGGGTRLHLRLQAYWTMTTGGTGHIYGHHLTWQTSWSALDDIDTVGVADLSIWKIFFSDIHWYDLIPDQDHSVVTAGYGTYNGTNEVLSQNTYATAARTDEGNLVVVYTPVSTTLTINMTKLSGSATARWFDPTDGSYATVSGSPFANTGSYNFATPGANSSGAADWVLLLEV